MWAAPLEKETETVVPTAIQERPIWPRRAQKQKLGPDAISVGLKYRLNGRRRIEPLPHPTTPHDDIVLRLRAYLAVCEVESERDLNPRGVVALQSLIELALACRRTNEEIRRHQRLGQTRPLGRDMN